ncbi:sodium:proton antiporter [Virgibacillus sp. AGTR]|uniref:Sodium:proton antiporter n=1 Tax=Virgibacillus salarius TaxID=447199 RepID=A0A941DVN4_9BACI|nr:MULTISPECIES: sodium:proton antiporter [Bacillaceae]MBR7797545.1 sodium:proton antiporter [Virgibacillus salarius]MCC2252328.1 sodium:proton antiporter [Virgibacillus sp. AGTR]NAZ10255.1 sodium:proton antiporter [Agaribacter marinus]QRZ19511.1 sodium:proton antiporter [Virgibacillus sp. AGTR]
MQELGLISIVVVIALGIFSQWFAWRIQWPSIVIMSIAGLLIGPIFGFINPEQALGDLYSPIISLAVAVILFEGSTTLDIREVKGISKSVFRVVTFGAFLAWVGGSLAAHFIAGLSLEIAFIIGGLFVVTGPTVIIPLLRQSKLKPRTAAVLKWEGIIVDPAGPLLALFAYEVIKVITDDTLHASALGSFFLASFLAIIIGYLFGFLLSFMASKGMFPEYLKSPITLSLVFICFALSEVIMHETGMLAVTVMGLTLARTKKYVSSLGNISHFIENISVLLTSTIFILLTASLTRETIGEVFTLPILGFVLVMLFIVRPLSIWISTIGTELTVAEKTLIGWIAPRGIVALTVSGYFASTLLNDGYGGASILTALTFALVFITVCAHGFTLGPLAKKLKLASSEPPGILIVGASSFSIAFAEAVKELGNPVLISDSSSGRLFQIEQKGIATYRGEILDEHSQFEMDITPYEKILAMTEDATYNALVAQSYIPEFGYNNTFTIPSERSGNRDESQIPTSVKAHLLFGKEHVFKELNRKINTNYSIQTMKVVEKMEKKEHVPVDGIPLCIRKKNGTIEFVTLRKMPTMDKDDQLVFLAKNN